MEGKEMGLPMNRIIQTRLETEHIVGRLAEKFTFTDEMCRGCKGSGQAPPILGLRDSCVLCFGTGRKPKPMELTNE